MHILAKLTANNKFQIKVYRVADGYLGGRKHEYSSEQRNNLRNAEILQKIEDGRAILRAYDKPLTRREYLVKYEQKSLLESLFPSAPVGDKQAVDISWCDLPSQVEYVSTEGGNEAKVVRTNYEDFCTQQKRLLDVLKKSQQPQKRHWNWGKRQRPKVFRYQAGEKIKEGGAIIDRFCGKENSTMITLTLPGSTYAAMNAVSRWSGWIVNRILQVVRRAGRTRPPIFWFFVWEHQKRGALHLHFCLGWKVSQEERERLALRVKNMWFKALLEINDKENIDCFKRRGFEATWRNKPEKWQWDVVQVKKSVAAYFAKYCQKNAECNGDNDKESNNNNGEHGGRAGKSVATKSLYYPSRYWGSSQTVKRWSKYITTSEKYTTYSKKETEDICGRIRRIALENAEILSVSVTRFENIDERNGIVISSGYVESYRFDPAKYPAFWLHCVDNLFEKSVCMDAYAKEFLGEELYASMQMRE